PAALQRAFGLDRDLRLRGRRHRAAEHAGLPVAVLLAGDLDVVEGDLLAEAGHLVGADRVGARDHAAALLDRDRHLGVGYGCALAVLDEAEIGRSLIRVVVVVIAESRAARPRDRRDDA